jgi:integrase/recombinase XerD
MVTLWKVRVPGPLAVHAVGFSEALLGWGYVAGGQGHVKNLRLMAYVSGWLVERGLDVAALGLADVVDAVFVARRAAGYATQRTAYASRPMMRYLRSRGVVPDPVVALTPAEAVLDRFRSYLGRERGLAFVTACNYVRASRRFVETHVAIDGGLAALTSAHVSDFVVRACSGAHRRTALWTTCGLRSLLSFLHVTGVLPGSLVAAVPSAASWRMADLPRGLAPDDVRRLAAAFDLETESGRRDRAMFLLMLRLGLRAGEVARLQLEDVDWRSGTLLVRGKGNRHERVPLPREVGEALAAYLRGGRPASAMDRSLFIRARAPRAGCSTKVVGHAMAAAGRRAGLIARVGPHRLRHTVATELVAAGATFPEIAQLLRHRSLKSTAIYSKVDREALRTLARPWPGATR